jgi:Na+/H+ antiporter NhaC
VFFLCVKRARPYMGMYPKKRNARNERIIMKMMQDMKNREFILSSFYFIFALFLVCIIFLFQMSSQDSISTKDRRSESNVKRMILFERKIYL